MVEFDWNFFDLHANDGEVVKFLNISKHTASKGKLFVRYNYAQSLTIVANLKKKVSTMLT